MICYMYLIKQFTDIKCCASGRAECFEDCAYYDKDCKNLCTLITIKKTKLNKNRKYGWIIEWLFKFDSPVETKNGCTKYHKIMYLNHPVNDFYIIEMEHFNKVSNVFEIMYRCKTQDKMMDFDDIESMHKWMGYNNYDGRMLTKEDFQ